AKSDWGQCQLTSEQLKYAASDVYYLHDLKGALEREMEKHRLLNVLEFELELLPVVVAMEARGIAVDVEKLRELQQEAESKRKEPVVFVRGCAGIPDLNPSSPKQLLKAFSSLGRCLSKTDEETLMACSHPLAKAVLAFRRWQKQEQQAAKLLKAV